MIYFCKGFFMQLVINLVMHIVRILVAFFIIKYAPEPQQITSFAKDSGWLIISLFLIMGYNIISFIILSIKKFKSNSKFCLGFFLQSIISFIYALKFCGL